MNERRGDRYLSVFLSVLIHAGLIGVLAWGWWRFRKPAAAPQTLAIEANVVRDQASTSAPAPATPAVPPPPTAPAPQPAPTVDEAAKLQQQQEAAQKAQAERQAKEKEEAERAAQAEAERQAKEEADRKAKEEADRKAEAERKAKEEEARKAQEAQQAQQRRDQAERAQREADLQSQLAAEEHLNAARASGEQAQYIALIKARIEHAWIRPPSAHAGIDCEVHVTQVPGGEVTGVQVGSCNGDDAVRQSIEAAVYRASPLPSPPDPALFERNLVVNFRPNE